MTSTFGNNMAFETCIAFILADDLDAEDYTSYLPNVLHKRKRISEKDDENFFTSFVPRLSVSEFQNHFQLTPTQVEELIVLLKPSWTCRNKGWTVRHAVLASLWTLATQESLGDIASRFHTQESIICDQLHEFCSLVIQNLSDRICWPQGQEAEKSVAGFFSVAGLPGTLCVVGSCHIPIEKPTDVPDPEEYRNSGQFYSINLMAFCNHAWCFVHANAEHPGSWHNSRVLSATEVGRALQEDPQALLGGRHIVGDNTFPLSEHLLTPYADYGNLEQKKGRYNLRVKAALRVVQMAFCSLKSRFQRLKSLQMNSLSRVSVVVKSCCILHNMCVEASSTVFIEGMEEDSVTQEPFHSLPEGHSGSLGGISKRQDVTALLGRRTKC